MAGREGKTEGAGEPLERREDGLRAEQGPDSGPPSHDNGTSPEALQSAGVASAGNPGDGGGNPGAGAAADGSLREQLEAARAERDANRENWLRTQAELENYRKRAQREMDEARRYQVLPLAREVLPVLDNLRRAIAAAEEAGDASGLVDGVRLVLKQFEDVLARHHVVPIEAVGQPFDPNLHEALQQVPSPDHPPLTVIEEFQRGYRLHDRVLRPSQVVVSSGPAE